MWPGFGECFMFNRCNPQMNATTSVRIIFPPKASPEHRALLVTAALLADKVHFSRMPFACVFAPMLALATGRWGWCDEKFEHLTGHKNDALFCCWWK